MKPVSLVVQAFHGCLIRVSGDTDSDSGQLRVDGSSGSVLEFIGFS